MELEIARAIQKDQEDTPELDQYQFLLSSPLLLPPLVPSLLSSLSLSLPPPILPSLSPPTVQLLTSFLGWFYTMCPSILVSLCQFGPNQRHWGRGNLN